MPDDVSAWGAIRSEARGPHWIAWRADERGKPERAIVIVGDTREEAERRAADWAERNLGRQPGGGIRPT